MATTVPSNATAEIALYERRLDQLYDLVQKAARSIDPAANVVRTSMVQIDEQLTGLYSVPSLELSMSGKPGIRLVPKGIYNIGARGRVDARSRLGTQVLVWVEDGGPPLTTSFGDGNGVGESSTRPIFTGVRQGWAWSDNRHLSLTHLTDKVFIDHVLPELVA